MYSYFLCLKNTVCTWVKKYFAKKLTEIGRQIQSTTNSYKSLEIPSLSQAISTPPQTFWEDLFNWFNRIQDREDSFCQVGTQHKKGQRSILACLHWRLKNCLPSPPPRSRPKSTAPYFPPRKRIPSTNSDTKKPIALLSTLQNMDSEQKQGFFCLNMFFAFGQIPCSLKEERRVLTTLSLLSYRPPLPCFLLFLPLFAPAPYLSAFSVGRWWKERLWTHFFTRCFFPDASSSPLPFPR